jgi:hypothetical protein
MAIPAERARPASARPGRALVGRALWRERPSHRAGSSDGTRSASATSGLSIVQTMLVGGAARAVAGALLNPIAVVKTHLESSDSPYRGLTTAKSLRAIVKAEGLRGTEGRRPASTALKKEQRVGVLCEHGTSLLHGADFGARRGACSESALCESSLPPGRCGAPPPPPSPTRNPQSPFSSLVAAVPPASPRMSAAAEASNTPAVDAWASRLPGRTTPQRPIQ